MRTLLIFYLLITVLILLFRFYSALVMIYDSLTDSLSHNWQRML